MGDSGVPIFLLFSCLLFLPDLSSSYPLCTDSRAPFTSKAPLGFCSYNGSVCCNSAQDSELQKQFELMNVSDIACASVLKSIICASCDPFSAELFKIESGPQTVPVLCNSSASVNSTKSNSEAHGFCSEVWDACQDVSILNSPFAPSLQGRTGLPDDSTSSKLTAPSLQGRAGVPGNSTLSKLTDLWQSKTDFCKAFAGSSVEGSVCFDGEPVTLNKTETSQSPKGLCLEKIGNGSYLNMVPHPDGSDRVFFSNQEGKIWLATVPDEESGGTLGLDASNPFVDLTDEVHFDTLFGIMGMAFHPDYARNGRFFVSFNCDKVQSPQCSGRCSCNSDANCDPSKLTTDDDSQPCRYHSVIAEYTANGTASSQVSLASVANPSEVRRIFTMGLPFTGHHGGQILFGPADGFLYFMMGDGGSKGDPYNFSQNKKSLLGKIMRLDIDNIPSAKEIDDLGLWGNYSIPKDNPSFDDKELQPEIWALGMRNPWRCSFDSERPSYFLCADVGQEQYEEVDIITKGGNYGWRVYEGDTLHNPTQSTTGNTSSSSSNFIFPILGYSHSDVNKNEGSASITGGYFYRSMTDPCMYGRYLYADLYATALWAAEENPKNSGNFTPTEIPFSCAHDTPIRCASISGSSLPSLGYIYSFGEDNKKNIFLLTSTGVYRVVRPSRCNYTCSKETASTKVNPSTTPSSPSSVNRLSGLRKEFVFLFSTSLLLLLSFI